MKSSGPTAEKKLQPSDLQDIGIKKLMDRIKILEAAKDQQPARTQRDVSTVKSVIQTVPEVFSAIKQELNRICHNYTYSAKKW